MTKTNQIGRVATTVYSEFGYTVVRYHQTEVVKFNDRFVELDSGGWQTATTKTRINQTSNQFGLGFNVWQTDYKWTVKLPNNKEVGFVDGMIIDRQTGDLYNNVTVDSLASDSLTHYIGDINPEFGGAFYNLDNWTQGWVDLTRITDLDSGCGFDSAVLIEKGGLTIPKPETIKSALICCGGIRGLDSVSRRLSVVDAIVWYMGFDVDRTIIIQTDSDGPMRFDGWKADIKLSSGESLLDWLNVNQGWIET
jgi:hypothetical protein